MTEFKQNLTTDQVLVCAPELDLHLSSRQEVRVQIGDRAIVGDNRILAILQVFMQPTSLKRAADQLSASVASKRDWIDLMNAILMLHRQGVLVDPGAVQPHVSGSSKGFDTALVHIAMLNDRPRTQSYLDAIREVVQPGDVVVDLGTGTGVLAIAAAQAGASRVYAIERGAIGETALLNFAANQVADRITLVRGRSTQVQLPERADVLVSEIIGTEPLGERVLEFTADAIERFLKPDARLIPAKMDLYFQPFMHPDEFRQGYFFTDPVVADWQSWYGIDFSPMLEITPLQPFTVLLKATKPRAWHPLCDPALFATLDLTTPTRSDVEWTQRFTIERPGRLDSILIYPDVHLSPTISLTRDPFQVDETSSWFTPVWMLPQSFEAQAGDQFQLTYRHPMARGTSEISVTRL